jgi:hypothetical protein
VNHGKIVSALISAATLSVIGAGTGVAAPSEIHRSSEKSNIHDTAVGYFTPNDNTVVKRSAEAMAAPGASAFDAAAATKLKNVKYAGELCGLQKIGKISGQGKTTLVLTVSKSVSAQVESSATVEVKVVSAGVGFKVDRTYTVEDQTRYEVSKGKYGYVEAYPLYDQYTFNVYKGGKKKGSGYAMKPVGVCFNQWSEK